MAFNKHNTQCYSGMRFGKNLNDERLLTMCMLLPAPRRDGKWKT